MEKSRTPTSRSEQRAVSRFYRDELARVRGKGGAWTKLDGHRLAASSWNSAEHVGNPVEGPWALERLPNQARQADGPMRAGSFPNGRESAGR